MNKRDQYELTWWREIFAPRFEKGELPEVGTPLFGNQLKVYRATDDGDVAWSVKPALDLVDAGEEGVA